ncbi:MAG: MarR family transcriptional regulator [Chloroflexi bacterium]|nr:MarR family transcriptional regulator [Chloroflexota bacterium]
MDPLVTALDRLVIGSVALTERAIAAAGTDLTFVQWRVLMIVGERDGGATVGEIAERIGARSSPASRLIGRLRTRGVVETTKDPGDARITRVRLTESGLELRRRVLGLRREAFDDIASILRLSPVALRGIELIARALETYA